MWPVCHIPPGGMPGWRSIGTSWVISTWQRLCGSLFPHEAGTFSQQQKFFSATKENILLSIPQPVGFIGLKKPITACFLCCELTCCGMRHHMTPVCWK